MNFTNFFGRALLLISVSCYVSACNKNSKETIVSGKVLEINSGKAVSNADVVIFQKERTVHNTIYTPIDSTKSNVNGNYSYQSILANKNYVIKAFSQSTFNSLEGIGRIEDINIQPCQVQTKNIEVWGHAWLQVRFLDTSGADLLNINPFGTSSGYSIMKDDYSTTDMVLGNDTTTLYCYKYYGSAQEKFNVSIYCNAHDTANLLVEY